MMICDTCYRVNKSEEHGTRLIRPSAGRHSLTSPLSLPLYIAMNTVPADVLLEIADHFSCPSEVLHLYLTVRANN
jgi:hypothetical protein